MSKARDLANAGTALGAVDATELGYLDGVTSPIQTQLDARITNALVDAKGDLLTATADNVPARLAVGANDTVLTADSSTATGLKWATPSGVGWSQTATGSLTGASVTVSSLSAGRFFVVLDAVSTSILEAINFRLNGDSGNNYIVYKQSGTSGSNAWEMTLGNLTAANTYYGLAFFVDLANTAASVKPIYIASATSYFQQQSLFYRSTSSITSMTFSLASGAFDAGTYTIWKQG